MVDDDECVLDALATGLAFQYAVHTARTGKEACAALRSQCVAIVLLDIRLRGEDGLGLIPLFRTFSQAQIILMTGYSTRELAIRAVWAHADGYLEKPLNLEAVLAAIDRLIGKAGARPNLAARVRNVLDANLEQRSTTAEVAKAVGLSRRNLYRQFRGTHAGAPGRFCTEVRVRHAADLLVNTPQALKEIAHKAGYSSSTAFIRAFKRVLGITPARFRGGQEADPPEGLMARSANSLARIAHPLRLTYPFKP